MDMPTRIRHRQATRYAHAEQHPTLRCVISAMFCAACSAMRASQAGAHLVSGSSSNELGLGPTASTLSRARASDRAPIAPPVSNYSAVLNSG